MTSAAVGRVNGVASRATLVFLPIRNIEAFIEGLAQVLEDTFSEDYEQAVLTTSIGYAPEFTTEGQQQRVLYLLRELNSAGIVTISAVGNLKEVVSHHLLSPAWPIPPKRYTWVSTLTCASHCV